MMSQKVICANCGFLDEGNYCSDCGKPLEGEPPAFLKQWFGDLLPVPVIRTWFLLLMRPTSVLRQAMSNDFSRISRPAPFLLTTYSFFVLVAALLGTSETTVTWYHAAILLPPEDSQAFARVFRIEHVSQTSFNETDVWESLVVGSSTASREVRKQVGSIRARLVADYLEDNAETALASRLRAVAADVSQRISWSPMMFFVIFPLVIFVYARALHMALRSRTRTPRETLAVAAYLAGFASPILGIAHVVAWEIWESGEAELLASAAVVPLLVFRGLGALEFTHWVGYRRGAFANVLAIGVAAVFKNALMLGVAIALTLLSSALAID